MPDALVRVSIVIAARDAAQTLAETLASLQAQTIAHWEAVVVDDASADATGEVARRFADGDARFRLVRTEGVGVSAARNLGIAAARGTWLLFLDADDWIKPSHLEKLLEKVEQDATLDAAYCGWERVAPDGSVFYTDLPAHEGDLFPVLAQQDVFAIHSCLVRREAVGAANGFDETMSVGEDWDLWQRLARTGVLFGRVPEVLACYRMRRASASDDALRLLRAAARVVAQGHAADARVPNPLPAYANGMPATDHASALYAQAVWCAGYAIGRGEPSAPLLDLLRDAPPPGLYPAQVARSLFDAGIVARREPPTLWLDLWPEVAPRVSAFLAALEKQTGIAGLARAAARPLEALVLTHAPRLKTVTVGATVGIEIDLAEPVCDVAVPVEAERLHVRCVYAGEPVGHLDVPVCDGSVSAYVLKDALADAFAWKLLGSFLARGVYPTLTFEEDDAELSVWRGDVQLARSLPTTLRHDLAALHDHVGWTVFLQELFGQPGWDAAAPYDPRRAEAVEGGTVVWAGQGPLRVELSQPLPAVVAEGASRVPVVPVVGSAALGTVWVDAPKGRISAAALRVALVTATGYELCRACVRAGVIGQGEHATPLRTRLAQHADAVPDGSVLVRRVPTRFGTSASRRVQFPRAAHADVRELGRAMDEHLMAEEATPKSLYYAPDVLGEGESVDDRFGTHADAVSGPADQRVHGRRYFESLFARGDDPWRYTTPYEQTKYEQTLDLLPKKRFEKALELACAEGHFTVQLAPRVGHLVAADISELALQRTARRCADCGEVEYLQLDLACDPIPGQYDLVVCSEVLYYMGSREALGKVAARVRDALLPGGYLVMAHAHAVVDEPAQAGFDWDVPYGAAFIGKTFAQLPGLRLLKELKTPLYRIQLFQRTPRTPWSGLFRPTPERTVLEAQPSPLEPAVAARVLWNGGTPRADAEVSETARLPILMYHRVAPSGDARMKRFRVAPEVFEAHLRYLRDAGYYTIGLDDWAAALDARRPLPGNAVLLTFDDGYAGFATYAWPLLEKYGFTATVFLVTDAVGTTNAWDIRHGESVRLMDWDQIRSLQRAGITFGSHTKTHSILTSLTPAQIVEEAVRSRRALERQLGVPPQAFCYPYGIHDAVVDHLVGGCGYLYGLSVEGRPSTLKDSLLSLPRIEVTGYDTQEDFISKLY